MLSRWEQTSLRARLRGRVTTYAPMPVNPVSRLFCAVRLWDPLNPEAPWGVCRMSLFRRAHTLTLPFRFRLDHRVTLGFGPRRAGGWGHNKYKKIQRNCGLRPYLAVKFTFSSRDHRRVTWLAWYALAEISCIRPSGCYPGNKFIPKNY